MWPCANLRRYCELRGNDAESACCLIYMLLHIYNSASNVAAYHALSIPCLYYMFILLNERAITDL
uniref:Uncharacterized protein n=1 Tax=Anguilla anguilla TaxID=7936 RepID=A0A0E9PCK3_ANGAN